MGVSPSYYRQLGELYPPNAIILTEVGTFPLELEHYLGQAGADSVTILNRQDHLKNIYFPFVRYQDKSEFVDYTKPRVLAFRETFVVPSSLGKRTLKTGKTANQLAPFISLISGALIYSSLYMLVRDCRIIANSIKLITKSKNIKKFLLDALKEDPQVQGDPAFKSLKKVTDLREKIYKRNLVSALISIAMTVSLIAGSIIALIAVIASAYPLLIGAAVITGSILLGHCIKAAIEWKGRLDKASSEEILEHNEVLRVSIPQHLICK